MDEEVPTSWQTRKHTSKHKIRHSVRCQCCNEGYEDISSSGFADVDGPLDDAPHTSPDSNLDGDVDVEGEVGGW
ncbi:uncharacterized protein B0H18DRAFT_981505 [Fomitopsis serialis]|uniref:uncharacterized protein n=1 Tax=Fomitopsis serialis TaxID=139415 RepID=UPI0020082E51|nr:uncharacterized protein B0H18DRAFT_981505 [Neoantrodia serialis]KAH9934380.1 hypothetical protein B0H18DRAFT_981505 [Neoantrodia serialis]